jgi:hypothetical protein
MLDFGLEPQAGQSKPHLLRDLARFLIEQRSAGRLALLIIDEAQNLSLPALEEVRMLSNLETEKSKLIQIVMVGQPNLRTILARSELEQLRQRITVSYHLQPLDAAETGNYINHRLRQAAIGAPLEFPRAVTDVVHLHAEGIPRKINVIADAMLLFGYGEERHTIDLELTREVVEELESTGVIAPPSPDKSPAAMLSRQATVTPPTQQTARDTELAQREAQLAAREQQLARQQRAMLEEHRLLRARRDTAAPAAAAAWPPVVSTTPPTPATPPPATPPVASGGAITHVRVAQPSAAASLIRPRYAPVALRAPYHAVPTPSVWARMRRAVFGLPKPLEE